MRGSHGNVLTIAMGDRSWVAPLSPCPLNCLEHSLVDLGSHSWHLLGWHLLGHEGETTNWGKGLATEVGIHAEGLGSGNGLACLWFACLYRQEALEAVACGGLWVSQQHQWDTLNCFPLQLRLAVDAEALGQ
jgi:hypothetical protein